jgi:CheY-like chemotaxis protein
LKRIFIVDDSGMVRNLVRSHLESRLQGIVCSEAEDGLEAVQRAADLQPDLILLDFYMPRLNGLEAAAVLHRMLPAVPIVLYTLHKEIIHEPVARAAGVRAVISKTDPVDILVSEVLNLVGVTRSASA